MIGAGVGVYFAVSHARKKKRMKTKLDTTTTYALGNVGQSAASGGTSRTDTTASTYLDAGYGGSTYGDTGVYAAAAYGGSMAAGSNTSGVYAQAGYGGGTMDGAYAAAAYGGGSYAATGSMYGGGSNASYAAASAAYGGYGAQTQQPNFSAGSGSYTQQPAYGAFGR